ncbi:type II toxin-antitoxin system RelE/ParE family toxin [Pseudomonas sessilinigenes]|uniref:Type II toxin-antitoxin system RelE/ParE family toxin n=1 Tax=Pseudomonas sessilinigenes TaxID=658629 RepID=A0ABX8MIE0_9PSED|nr:type II toxin-antitoxin system RelE/ParE family toxin [Pseudomonas sessilinigenes]QXH37841.1 type II toxin-antitoxin system RelE/ParE family toxin [Pseudomonas sessilinigenes]
MSQLQVHISKQARTDVIDILRYTEVRFGEGARRRYQSLLQNTFRSLGEEPERLGSVTREEISPGLRSLHLFFCRSENTEGRVVRPRHIVFYRSNEDQVVEVVRVLHDAMELTRHLGYLQKP